MTETQSYNWGMTWAQIATMPTNSTIEASAAASSTNNLNILALP